MACSNVFGVYVDEYPLEKSCSNLETLRKHEDFKDLEIQVENGNPVMAQKIVLAARIPFLSKLVNRPPLQWDLKIVDNECAECIVSYAYTGRLPVTRGNVANILSFCKTLKLEQIVKYFTRLLIEKLNLDHLSLCWTISKDNDLVTLKEKCINLMQENFEKFISTSLFLQLDFRAFKSLISSNELDVINEDSVFGAIKTWIQADRQVDREEDLDELVKCIRWSWTSPDFRKCLAEKDEMVKRNPSCVKYLSTVEHNISNPQGLFNANPRNTQQRILVFGDPSSGDRKWIAEIFDPVTERSTRLACLNHRRHASVVSVGGGNVLISGGEVDGKTSSSVELFSCPVKQSHPVASLNVARWHHGACAVGGAVVVCGGQDEKGKNLDSCEIYSQNRWGHFPAMKVARRGVAVLSSPDRRIFAIGGWYGRGGYLSSVEVCRLPDDFATSPLAEGLWESIAPMREARYGHAAVLFQGNLLVAGGMLRMEYLSSVEIFPINQEGAQWISLPASMKVKRCLFSLVVYSRGIFAFDLHSSTGDDEDPRNSVERLNVLTNRRTVPTFEPNLFIKEISAAKWESLSPIISMKSVHRAILISNDL